LVFLRFLCVSAIAAMIRDQQNHGCETRRIDYSV
jgi:hypothetical protein